ncbi:Fc.00g005840.m01.CDS01 [Cosmosporella sp. VM-42]
MVLGCQDALTALPGVVGLSTSTPTRYATSKFLGVQLPQHAYMLAAGDTIWTDRRRGFSEL